MARRRCQASDSDGFSLVELLVALAIMGIAVTAVLAALGTQIKGVRVHRNQSNSSAVLESAAEALKGGVAYQPCATPTTGNVGYTAYLNAARSAAVPSDWAAQAWTSTSAIKITAISFRNVGGYATVGSATYATDNICHDSDSADTYGALRTQIIRLVVVDPRGDDTETIDVVKRG